MYKHSVPFLNKNITGNFLTPPDAKELFKTQHLADGNIYSQLLLTRAFVSKYFNKENKVFSKSILRLVLELRMVLLSTFQTSIIHSKCPETSQFKEAVEWHTAIAKNLLNKVNRYPGKNYVDRNDFEKWVLNMENTYANSKFEICIKVGNQSNTNNRDRRTYLNIPQKGLSTLQGFAEKEPNKQSAYILVGLMQ
jgi:hypothetical protein